MLLCLHLHTILTSVKHLGKKPVRYNKTDVLFQFFSKFGLNNVDGSVVLSLSSPFLVGLFSLIRFKFNKKYMYGLI